MTLIPGRAHRMLQFLKRPVEKRLYRAVTHLGQCDIEDTIVVSGSPRSGTTWLSELLRVLPGYKAVNEPLHLDHSPLARELERLGWRPYAAPGTDSPQLEELLRKAFTGHPEATPIFRLRGSNPASRLIYHATRKKLVVKLIRASRMLAWVSERFPVRALVSIFRHPCAVVASRINYRAAWRESEPPEEENLQGEFGGETELGGRIPEEVLRPFRSTLSGITTTAGRLAAGWCLDNYMALQGPIRGPWIVTTYEALLEDPEAEMTRVLRDLGEPMPEEVRRQFDKPSQSAAGDLKTRDAEQQLAKWRRNLSDEQIDAILRVVHGFGLDFYNSSLRPDRKRLHSLTENARLDGEPVSTTA